MWTIELVSEINHIHYIIYMIIEHP